MRGRRERQRCAGQTDRLLFITQASLHMAMKGTGERKAEQRKREVKKNEGRGHSNSVFHFISP